VRNSFLICDVKPSLTAPVQSSAQLSSSAITRAILRSHPGSQKANGTNRRKIVPSGIGFLNLSDARRRGCQRSTVAAMVRGHFPLASASPRLNFFAACYRGGRRSYFAGFLQNDDA
jgi:hypothetical protein